MPDPPRRRDRSPAEVPTKICPACGRPFSWRRKWKAIWDQVVYCSDRCRKQGVKPRPG